MSKELLRVGTFVALSPKNKVFGVNKRESAAIIGILDRGSLYGFEDKGESFVFLSLSSVTKYERALNLSKSANGIEEKSYIALFFDYSLDEYEIRPATGIETHALVKKVWESRDKIEQTGGNGVVFDKLKEEYGIDIERIYNIGVESLNNEKNDADAIVKREEERTKSWLCPTSEVVLPKYNPVRLEENLKASAKLKEKACNLLLDKTKKVDNDSLKLFLVKFNNHEDIYVIDRSINGAVLQLREVGEIKSVELVATTGESDWLLKLRGNFNGQML